MPLMGKYEYVIDKSHPRANEDGQVYVHIIVAEEKLKRRLLPEEIVHHRDLNKLNNEPDNIMVFATKSDHTRFHMNNCDENMLSINANGAYVCKGSKHLCVDCGAEISRDAIRCVDCWNNLQRKTERPSSEKLYQMLVEIKGNFSEISKRFGVTDNAVRKWCRIYNIPYHSSFYKNLQN